MRDAYRAWEYVCKTHALTCGRCGQLAYPISLTPRRSRPLSASSSSAAGTSRAVCSIVTGGRSAEDA
jgi:hypothetical protein